MSIMAIRKTLTASQRQMTFEASRAENIGHADLAFAIFHAFANEPLTLDDQTKSKNPLWRFTNVRQQSAGIYIR